MTEVIRKGKVGRPRTSEPDKVVPKEGIVNYPLNYSEKDPRNINIMEILYDDPKLISNLLILIDELNTKNPVYMFFNRQNVEIHFKSDQGDIYILLKGSEMNRYFIKENMCIKLEGESIFKNLAGTAKIFNSIKFAISRKDLEEARKTMRIILVYDRKDSEDTRKINISLCKEDAKIPNHIYPSIQRLKSYPLRYDFDAVHLKQCVNQKVLEQSVKIRIFKTKENVLSYEYLKETGDVEYETDFRSPSKINLIYDEEDEEERVTFNFDRAFLSKLTNKKISDYGTVYISNKLRCCFTYLLDPEIADIKVGNKSEKVPVHGTEKIAIYTFIENPSELQKFLDRVAELND